MTDIAFQSATDLVNAIKRRKIKSIELLELYIERMQRHNPKINAIVATDLDNARQRALAADKALDKGESWGALHGLPMTIKDSFEVVGMPCTSGSPDLKDYQPAKNAFVVQKLLDEGAVIFGKTNLPLFAMDLQSYNEVYGQTNNPWNRGMVPGGSSGGAAAALAAGLTGLEMGSDIGGSIRNPAHFCGVFGHKPTFGIVPLSGHIPPPPGTYPGEYETDADIAVAGPIARSANDLDRVMGLINMRGTAMLHRNWLFTDYARTMMRETWADFFKKFDILLCPAVSVTAFPHDHTEDFLARKLVVNGEDRPYFATAVAWAGLTGMVYLPSTIAPVGPAQNGLPVGMQIVAPYLEDRTAIRFAGLVEDMVGGFSPPPDF